MVCHNKGLGWVGTGWDGMGYGWNGVMMHFLMGLEGFGCGVGMGWRVRSGRMDWDGFGWACGGDDLGRRLVQAEVTFMRPAQSTEFEAQLR